MRKIVGSILLNKDTAPNRANYSDSELLRLLLDLSANNPNATFGELLASALANMGRTGKYRVQPGNSGQNVAGSDSGIVPNMEDPNNPKYGTNPDLLNAPGNVGTMAYPGRSGAGPLPVATPSARGRTLASPTRNAVNNPPANVRASYGWKEAINKIRLVSAEDGTITHAGRIKPKSLLLQSPEGSNFSKNINTYNMIQKSSDGYHLVAVLSSTERDRDGDRFSREVLDSWNYTIKSSKINIGLDHGHSWKDTLGVWGDSMIKEQNGESYLIGDGKLEDPNLNENVKMLIHKWNTGEQVSISIAANPNGNPWYKSIKEKDGSSTRLITNAALLKADVVGEPANSSARAITVSNSCDCGNGSCLTCMGARP